MTFVFADAWNFDVMGRIQAASWAICVCAESLSHVQLFAAHGLQPAWVPPP